MVTVHATAAQTPSLNANAPWTHRGKVVSEYVQEKGRCLVKSTATNTSGETTLPELQLYNKHRYFSTQVQHQMFVCEKQEEYFYVYTTKDSESAKV